MSKAKDIHYKELPKILDIMKIYDLDIFFSFLEFYELNS